jgi:hypothetical protein
VTSAASPYEIRDARVGAGDGARPGLQIHVAHINVDGAIDMPFIRQRFPDLKGEDMLKPAAIADACRRRTSGSQLWTQELDVRPFKESSSAGERRGSS